MSEDLPDFSRLPEDSARNLHRFSVGTIALLVLLLFLAVVYSVGEKVQGFRWNTLRDGLFTSGVVVLGICLTIVAITAGIRGLTHLWPQGMQRVVERRQLKKARRAADAAIEKKHRLSEERARLTAQLKATFLFEKETTAARGRHPKRTHL